MNNLGLSGDLVSEKNDVIQKVCKTNNTRFEKNILKQIHFREMHINPVEILAHGINENNEYYINMPRLTCDNAIVWISKAEIGKIDELGSKFIEYFGSILGRSDKKVFDYNIWNDKIDELLLKISSPNIKIILNDLKYMTFSTDFYYGNYHGDFTLANLFINYESSGICIEAIDFLDTFISSPINDIVKLRQDLCHLWTVRLMQDVNFDINRAAILLKHLDYKIQLFIDSDEVLKEYYLPFQILNLIRILPYANADFITNFLVEEVTTLHMLLKARCL